jgi:predicted phosphodiesterase
VRTLIAGDWHLGTYSKPAHATLAWAFLERARREGDRVVLNGDIFEGVFEPAARAEAAHRDLSELMADMTRDGALRRTEGNHDPGAGPPELVLEHPTAGRVLVMHGHGVDPMHGSQAGRVGDHISRRFGHLAVVRGAAHAVEAVVAGAAASRVDRFFREKCRGIVRRHGCDLGVFGHNHRRYLVRGDCYANAGCLKNTRLEFLVLDDSGPRLDHLELTQLGTDAAGALAASTAPN